MKTIILTIVCFYLVVPLYGTAQFPDIIIYKGDTMALNFCPLEKYLDKSLVKYIKTLGGKKYFSTACWRNYIAIWEIIDNKLFLIQIRNARPIDLKNIPASTKTLTDSIGDNEHADLEKLFPDCYKDGKVFADWATADMISPQGKMLFYIHDGYESSYERELEFKFKEGILQGTKIYDNSKSKKSIYSASDGKLIEWIENHIQWKNLPDFLPEEKISVTLRFSANDDGIIDDVVVVRGYNEIFDKEAIRVIKSIPEWDVYFKLGKYQRLRWNIRIPFSKFKKKG